MLIDDAPGLRKSLSRAAELSGLTLLTAESWDEGLAMFQVHSPTVVIADYNLPGSQHGLQLLAEIRRLNPSVRLLLLSMYIDDQDVPEIEALGLVDRAIPKSGPDVTDEILAEVEAARDRAAVHTDWSSYAKAHRQSRAVQQSEIDELDARMKSTRGIS